MTCPSGTGAAPLRGHDVVCDDATVTTSLTNRLVLWDVDRTLLSIGPVSQEIYSLAFERVTGSLPRAIAPMAGRTERAIITETLALNGQTHDENVFGAFYDALGQAAPQLKDRMVSQGQALPGSKEAIKLIGEAGGTQSLVTGNIRPIALTKLQAFGLEDGLMLDTGGYGDHSSDRSELVEFAIARTGAELGDPFTPANTVIIGDTPHDVEGAHRAGATAIGGATGASTRADLLEAGADHALEDLRDGPGLVELIRELTSDSP